MTYILLYGMNNQINKQTIEAIETVLQGIFEQDIEEFRTKRLCNEFNKFCGVRD